MTQEFLYVFKLTLYTGGIESILARFSVPDIFWVSIGTRDNLGQHCHTPWVT